MSKLREVLAAVSAVQLGVSIYEPTPLQIKRVYPYLPDGNDALDTPCVINQWRFVSEQRRPNNFRELRYLVRSQVFVAESGTDFDAYSEAAAALHDALITAMDAQLQLDGSVSITNIRGDEAEFMPVVFEREPQRYIGLQYLMDVIINDVSNFGP